MSSFYHYNKNNRFRGKREELTLLYPDNPYNHAKFRVLKSLANPSRHTWTLGLLAEHTGLKPNNVSQALINLCRFDYAGKEDIQWKKNGKVRRCIYFITSKGHGLLKSYQKRAHLYEVLGVSGQENLNCRKLIQVKIWDIGKRIDALASVEYKHDYEAARIHYFNEHEEDMEYCREILKFIIEKHFPTWPNLTG